MTGALHLSRADCRSATIPQTSRIPKNRTSKYNACCVTLKTRGYESPNEMRDRPSPDDDDPRYIMHHTYLKRLV